MSKKNTPEHFWSNINVGSPDKCWEWRSMAGKNDYAMTRYEGKNIQCHRKAYELTFGAIPDGLYACHTCDNPPCCNPYHIFLGTHQDNVDDRERKGRNKLPHCIGEAHGQHKLTEDDIKQIRFLYAMGKDSYRGLGSIYKVSFGQIRNIIKNKEWAWLE